MTDLITEARELCELRRKQKHIPMTMLDKTLELCDALETALTEIDRLTEAQRWIPVSEKPRRTQNCLCLFNDGSMAIAWYNGVPYEFHPDITRWMPLPDAPKGDSHE